MNIYVIGIFLYILFWVIEFFRYIPNVQEEFADSFQDDHEFDEEAYQEFKNRYWQKYRSQRTDYDDPYGRKYQSFRTSGYRKNIFEGMTYEQAKKLRKELLRKYHPDNGKTGNQEYCKQILRDFEVFMGNS